MHRVSLLTRQLAPHALPQSQLQPHPVTHGAGAGTHREKHEVFKYLIVGAGMQGQLIARNLATRRDTAAIVLVDVRVRAGMQSLPPKCVLKQLDALDLELVLDLCKSFQPNAAVLAVPESIALRALSNVIAAKVPCVDISFAERPDELSAKAKEAGVPVVVDMGVSPGLSHVLSAALVREMGGLDDLVIYVGSLPLLPPPFFKHAVYMHARDLLSEYIRPARVRQNGRNVTVRPLEMPVDKLVDLEVGPLEAFTSNGLRSLPRSFPNVPNMREATLRVPGHIGTMTMLKTMGLLEGDSVTDRVAEGLAARFPSERFPDRLLLEVWGTRAGRRRCFRLHVTSTSEASALSRATGYPAATIATLMARKQLTTPGLLSPDFVGKDEKLTHTLLSDLDEYGIAVSSVSQIRIGSYPAAEFGGFDPLIQ